MKTFRKMLKRMEELKQKVEEFNNKVKPSKMGEWVDAEIVCRMLNISKRTLQSYREKGFLPYSIVRHKIFFRIEDVVKLLEENRVDNSNNKKC